MEEDGLCGLLGSKGAFVAHWGHLLGDRRIGFLAEGVIWWMHAFEAHFGG